MDLFALLTKLTAIHGPSGQESAVAREILDDARPYADEFYLDFAGLGSLALHKKGNGAKLMLAAHMDTVGLVATFLEEDGTVRFGKLGGVHPKEIRNALVRFENGTVGTIKVHGKADETHLTVSDLYLDIGVESREEAEKLVKLGDTAVYQGQSVQNGTRVISPYLDNRVSCAVLLKTFEQIQKSENDLWCVFTTQEEVGLRGAKTAAYEIQPEYAVAVDVTGASDWPGASKLTSSALGKGAAVKVMDASVICHTKMVEILTGLAKERNIPYQMEVNTKGGTDAGVIHQSRGGVITGGVSIPCRYTHTPTEMIDLRDAEACVSLLTALIERKL